MKLSGLVRAVQGRPRSGMQQQKSGCLHPLSCCLCHGTGDMGAEAQPGLSLAAPASTKQQHAVNMELLKRAREHVNKAIKVGPDYTHTRPNMP